MNKREIKFRGLWKGPNVTQMVCGFVYENGGSSFILHTRKDTALAIGHSYFGGQDITITGVKRVEPETTGQSTGLKNISGEVYHGDILRGNAEFNQVVIECNGGLSLVSEMHYGHENREIVANPTNSAQTSRWIMGSETLGNIHEHPELLK